LKIKPIFIEVTNFLSYHYQRFDFKNGLFFISGANGAGKTSFFIESCSYCLYNKSMSGKKLSELINKDATKNMVVSVLLNINNQFVLVERGESPKKFSVFVETKENISFVNKKTRLKINDDEFIKVNDIILKKSNQLAENFDMQEWLEESILKMNHKDFITYVLKSKAKDLSYLEMNKDERDKYLENLFNLGTFRVMNESLKLKMKDQEIIVEKQKKELDKFKIELEFEEKKNLELKELFDRNNEDKINIQKKAIEKLDNEDATTKIIQENLLSTNKEINQLKLVNPVEKIDNHIEQNNQEIIILEKKNDALENSYTKDDKISEIKKKEIEANLSNLDKTIEDDKKEIKTTGEKLKIEIADIEKEIKNQTELLTEHSKSYDNLSDLENKELEILTKQNEATKQNIQENNLIIESNKKKLYDLKTKYEYESGLYETNKKDLNEKKFKLLGKVEASKDLLKNFNIEDKDLLKKEIESQLPLLEKKYPNLYSFLINFSKSLNETIDNISLLENKISKIKEKLDALENNKITVDGLSLDIRHTEVKIFEITEQNDGLKENLDTNKKLIETLNSEISGKLSVFTAKKYNLELKLNNLNNSLNKKQNDLVELRNNYKKMDIEKTKQLELLNKQLQDNLSDAVLLEKN
jgi:DNA repair exonuclease SbcCD ATPase subunit